MVAQINLINASWLGSNVLMKKESFHLQFNWQNNQRRVQIRSEKVTDAAPVVALYEVYWDEVYMFTLYPTFNEEANKTWKIVEEELATDFPPGFIIILGTMIEDAYLLN
jgi:hypothetical protein